MTEEKTYPDWFAKKIVWLFALYPQATASSATPEAWWMLLRDLPKESIIAAFSKSVATSPEFCPSAPKLRQWAEAHAKSDPKRIPKSHRIEEKPFSDESAKHRIAEIMKAIGDD